jgi:predicted Rossmann fold nucleotide-binding protein DprA/Smf involved in DNA uptake
LSLLADASDGLSLEAIANKTGMQIAETSAVLLNMELSGVVRQLPGKIYVIC